ncbi:MAG TPA: hypothetical protein VJS89_10635 [Gammaproteobacteria bacterium]|nr:hypothetical protein [Gammaproteobacteria bacterium]
MNWYFRLPLSAILLSAAPLMQAATPPGATIAAPAPAAGTQAQPPPGAKPASTELGEVKVKGMRELIRSLEVVKVALKQPFSSDPAQANTVVCRIITGHGHPIVEERMGAVLQCGTNSWYLWRKDTCRNTSLAQCASGAPGSAYKRPGAWVSYRALNFQQLMHMRQLLKELPEPGKGDVVVVDAKGKTMMTVKAKESSGPDGTN